MTAGLASDGLVVGFDGSQMLGRDEAKAELGHIFADHEVATYVTKVRSVKSLGREAGLLHAVAGMVPPAGDEIMPDRNAIQTVAARRVDGDWMVVLFQTTPASSTDAPNSSRPSPRSSQSLCRGMRPNGDPLSRLDPELEVEPPGRDKASATDEEQASARPGGRFSLRRSLRLGGRLSGAAAIVGRGGFGYREAHTDERSIDADPRHL